MNKRQSKKQDLSNQVENFRRSSNVNVAIVDENFEYLLEKLKAQSRKFHSKFYDLQSRLDDLEFKLEDMENHIRSLCKISIIQSFTIIALAIALIWRWQIMTYKHKKRLAARKA